MSGVVKTFTKEEVETMITEATSKANGEAASNRHALKEITEKLEALELGKKETEDKRLSDNQEFKTLADARKGELDTLVAEQTALNERISAYETRDEARLVKLLELVPESQRPLIKDNFSLSDRIELAESLALTKTPPPGTRLPGEGGEYAGKNPFKKETRNLTEQARLMREDPTKAAQLKTEAKR